MQKIIDEIITTIKENHRFLITAHQKPDGDAIGSCLGLASLIERLGKKTSLTNSDITPENYLFIPNIEKIKKLDVIEENFDVAFILDCADLKRLGYKTNLKEKAKTIVNIDHHNDSERFGHINYINSNASSNAEQIYTIFKQYPIEISELEALYLYIGIVSDTNKFQGNNTTAYCHEIASELISKGINPREISRKIYEEKEPNYLRFLGKTIETLQTVYDNKISYMILTQKLINEYNAEKYDFDECINFARSIKGTKVAMLFKETKNQGEIKVSLRSNNNINVFNIAKKFSGGGHKMASGCSLTGTMDEVINNIIKEVSEII